MKMKTLFSFSPLALFLVAVIGIGKLLAAWPGEKQWWPCESTCGMPPNQCPEPPDCES
jgi:hypothetical protein